MSQDTKGVRASSVDPEALLRTFLVEQLDQAIQQSDLPADPDDLMFLNCPACGREIEVDEVRLEVTLPCADYPEGAPPDRVLHLIQTVEADQYAGRKKPDKAVTNGRDERYNLLVARADQDFGLWNDQDAIDEQDRVGEVPLPDRNGAQAGEGHGKNGNRRGGQTIQFPMSRTAPRKAA